MLSIFVIWEAKFAGPAIMSLDIMGASSFLPLAVVVLFSFMSFGPLLWYMVAWQQLIQCRSALPFAG